MMRILMAALAALGFSAIAQAQDAPKPNADHCTEISEAALKQAVSSGRINPSVVQSGIRSALERYMPLLKDDLIGPVTTAALVDLCRVVPLPEETDPMSGGLALSQRYASIDRILNRWLDKASAIPRQPPTSGFRRRIVQLAGPAAVAKAGIEGAAATSASACVSASSAVAALSDSSTTYAKRGLAAMFEADPALAAAGAFDFSDLGKVAPAAVRAICMTYQVNQPAATILDFASRLGQIEARYPGAVAALGDPAFGNWVLTSTPDRPRRLLGTPGAVYLLLADYLGLNAFPSCLSREYDSVSMLTSDIEHLKKRPDLAKALKAVAGPFPTSDELTAEVSGALGIDPAGCVAEQVKKVVESSSSRGQTFSFSDQALAEIKLDPELGALAPTIEALSKASVPDETKWTGAMQAGLTARVAKIVTEKVDAAAAAVAQAATEVPTTKDTALKSFTPQPADGEPPPPLTPPAPKPAPPGFAITGNTLQLIAPKIDDPEIVDALDSMPQKVFPSRAALKQAVELGLQDYSAQKRETLETRAAAILGLGAPPTVGATGQAAAAATTNGSGVEDQWVLTPQMIYALARDVPALAPLPAETLKKLETLAGIDYPNPRLFDAALQAPPAEIDVVSMRRGASQTGNQLWPILDVALKVADPLEIRKAVSARGDDASINADCGCAVRWAENTVIYAFYPFWELGHPRVGKETRPLLDFEAIDRVAFHGLQIEADGRMDASRVALWKTAGPSFVLSAHQHKVKADLSIRLRGWRNWISAQARAEGAQTPANSKQAAEKVGADVAAAIADAVKLGSATGLPGTADQGLLKRAGLWLNQRWLSTTPDGVTLVIDGYDGTPPDDGSIEVLLQLLEALALELADTDMTINIALDIPLEGDEDTGDLTTTETPLFEDLRALLAPRTGNQTETAAASGIIDRVKKYAMEFVSDAPRGAPINYVLVFLQRPTSDAKKLLRRRIEDSFQGEERATTLRKIVPIVPNAAHQDLLREERLGVSSKSAPVLQFVDDVVYFQDNFGGMGFWPSPSMTVASQLELTDDVLRGFDSRRDYLLPTALRSERLGDEVARPSAICDAICTNRAIGYLANNLVVAVALGIIVLSFFSWHIDLLKRGTMVVPLLALALIGSHIALAICANGRADWARLILVLVVIGSIVLYRQITRWRRGLLP